MAVPFPLLDGHRSSFEVFLWLKRTPKCDFIVHSEEIAKKDKSTVPALQLSQPRDTSLIILHNSTWFSIVIAPGHSQWFSSSVSYWNEIETEKHKSLGYSRENYTEMSQVSMFISTRTIWLTRMMLIFYKNFGDSWRHDHNRVMFSFMRKQILDKLKKKHLFIRNSEKKMS